MIKIPDSQQPKNPVRNVTSTGSVTEGSVTEMMTNPVRDEMLVETPQTKVESRIGTQYLVAAEKQTGTTMQSGMGQASKKRLPAHLFFASGSLQVI